VRDRIGLKPFYYSKWMGGVAAASNAGALIASGLVPAVADEEIVARYAVSNYRAFYGRAKSLFRDVRLVPPATVATVTEARISESRFWEPPRHAPHFEQPSSGLEEDYRRTLTRMMERCVAYHGASRPAVALSGGLDSGTIAGLLHRVTGGKAEAISMLYEEGPEATDFDERTLMRCSARDHIDRLHEVFLGADALGADLPTLYDRFDLPLPTVSIYGYEFLYRTASRLGMRSVLTGSGGDALQAGTYPGFLYHLADLKTLDPRRYEHELACWSENHSTEQFPKSPAVAEAFFARHVDLSSPGTLKPAPILLSAAPHGGLQPELARRLGSLDSVVVGNFGSFLASYAVQDYWVDDVSVGAEAEDLMEWHHDIALVSPFADKEVVEFGLSLPIDAKIKDGVNKVLARRALRGICADEVLDRVAKAVEAVVARGLGAAMNEFNRRDNGPAEQ